VLHKLLPLLEADLFGDVADAKEVAAVAAAYREAKRCRSYDTYRLLASMVTVRTHLVKQLSTVRIVSLAAK
jgi:U3 small nucleolar RNA-associated protein 20